MLEVIIIIIIIITFPVMLFQDFDIFVKTVKYPPLF